VKGNRRLGRAKVSADGTGLMSRAGTLLLRESEKLSEACVARVPEAEIERLKEQVSLVSLVQAQGVGARQIACVRGIPVGFW